MIITCKLQHRRKNHDCYLMVMRKLQNVKIFKTLTLHGPLYDQEYTIPLQNNNLTTSYSTLIRI